jgi:hypothetical protein
LDRFAVNARDYERPGNLFDSRTNWEGIHKLRDDIIHVTVNSDYVLSHHMLSTNLLSRGSKKRISGDTLML